jgi:hypothetical protein
MSRVTFYNPPGSGIDGRPILHDLQPGVRHLAYRRGDHWYTWCGLDVPDDHECPTEAEMKGPPVWGTPLNCAPCHQTYRQKHA